MGAHCSHDKYIQDDRLFVDNHVDLHDVDYDEVEVTKVPDMLFCASCCRKKSDASMDAYKNRKDRPASFTYETAVNTEQIPNRRCNVAGNRTQFMSPKPPYNIHYQPPRYTTNAEEVKRRRSPTKLCAVSSNIAVCHHHQTTLGINRPGLWKSSKIPPFPLVLPDSDRPNQSEYQFCASSQVERESWTKEFNRVIWKPYGGGIFGLRLEETMQYEDRLFNRSYSGRLTQPREAPIIVENCVDFVRKHGLKEEGLFRLPGQTNDVKDLQNKFDTGNRPQFGDSTDIHTVTSLLKSYLRELPEPAVPFSMYSTLVDAVKDVKLNSSPHPTDGSPRKESESQQKARQVIKEQLKRLPKHNFNLLRYLCRFLDEVQSHSEENKMDISNLALMFGPNLIRPADLDPKSLMNDSTYVQYIMVEFITNHEYYFPYDEKKHRPTSSIPDVVPETNKNRTLPRPRHAPPPPPPKPNTQFATNTVTSVNSTEGFDTMTTMTSPPGTLPHHITDDSGTGSMGPTPDNTSRRLVSKHPLNRPLQRNHSESMIMEENESGQSDIYKQRSTSEVLMRTNQANLRFPASQVPRKSIYDNLTPSTKSGETTGRVTSGLMYEFSGDWQTKNESGPTSENSIVNENRLESTDVSEIYNVSRSSTNAVAGSSVSGKTINSDIDDLTSAASKPDRLPTHPHIAPKPLKPRKPRPTVKKIRSTTISDEESNTESLPITEDRGDLTSVSSRQNSQSSLYSGLDASGAPPEKPPRRRFSTKNMSVSSRAKQFDMDSVSRTSSCINSNASQHSSYHDLQLQIKELHEELNKQKIAYEKRSQMLEEHFVSQLRSLSTNSSSAAANTSDNSKVVDQSNRYSFLSVSSIDSRLQAHEEQFVDLAKRIEELEKKNIDETKRHKMTKIQLNNAERGRQAAEQRNEELQLEMKNFFNTFGEMFVDSSQVPPAENA